MTDPNHSPRNLSQALAKRTPDPKRVADLIAALEAQKQDLEQTRGALRREMAETEWELGRLTSQQAELQKIQVALDRLLGYLRDDLDPRTKRFESDRPTGLADAGVSGTS